MQTTAAEYYQLVKAYYDEKEDYVPRIVDVACEEAADLEANMKEVIENERRRMEARVEAARTAYFTALQQRDSIILIAGIPPLQKVVMPGPEAVAEHIPELEAPAAPPAQAPELQDAGSEGSADEKGRWIQKGTTYKISSFLTTRIAEINAGTRTSPVASISWKGSKFSPNNPHLHSVISFWQVQGPMNSATARTRWASAGGAWEKGGLRGAMRELIKQQILVPV